jgi:hypothetical protein
LKENGFVCPQLNFALRNPQVIADRAQKVIQDGARNFLDAVLRSPIKTSITAENMVAGQLIEIKRVHTSPKDALCASQLEVPFGKHALFFIDNKTILENGDETIKEAFKNGPMPILFTGKEDTSELKDWLCYPEKRVRDMCILGTDHHCNGIETDLVVHIYVADCPVCQISNADPVVISRAKAMLILSTYVRLKCSCCGWKMSVQEEPEDGWKTPTEESEEEDELFEDSQVLLDPGQPSSSEPVSNLSEEEDELFEDSQVLLDPGLPSSQPGSVFSMWKKIKESNKKCKAVMIAAILMVLVGISITIIAITWPPKGKPRIRLNHLNNEFKYFYKSPDNPY